MLVGIKSARVKTSYKFIGLDSIRPVKSRILLLLQPDMSHNFRVTGFVGKVSWSLLCVVLLIFLTTISWAGNLDSLKIETKNDDTFIVHQVESKETLYSLARRYHTQVSEIEKVNPTLRDGLKVGQTLRIPYTSDAGQDVQSTYHTVTSQQTMYSIAATYGISLDQLREWNNLTGTDLNVGQKLIIGKAGEPVNAQESDASQSEDQDNPTTYAQIEDILDKEVPPTIIVAPNEVGKDRIVKQENGFTEVLENGLAQVIEDSKDTRKYLALHKTAPVGTILQIRNEMNNLRVFVRVIGQLPDTGNNVKILLKISKAAYDRLGAIDARFPVVVTYFL